MSKDFLTKERECVLRLKKKAYNARTCCIELGNRTANVNMSKAETDVMTRALNYYYDYLDEEARKQ